MGKQGLLIKLALTITILVALGLLTWFALHYVPYFNITTTKIVLENNISSIPSQAIAEAKILEGQSIFSINKSNEVKKFEAISIVEKATITKELPSTLIISLKIRPADAVIVSYNDDDTIYKLFVTSPNSVQLVESEDFKNYKDNGLVVIVTKEFSDLIDSRGLNNTLIKIIDLTKGLGETKKFDTSLISRIKYNNSRGDSFSGLNIYIDSLSCMLSIREPITLSVLLQSINLVITLQKDSGRIYQSSEVTRYDVYSNAVINRNRRISNDGK